MSVFARAAAALRRRGVLPATTELTGTATYVTVTGYRPIHIAYAVVMTIACCGSSAGLALSATGYWISTPHDRIVVEAITSTGVDVSALSEADLQARLAYPAVDGRALVDVLSDGKKPLIDDVVAWIRTLDPERRKPAAANLMRLAAIAASSPTKYLLIDVADRMSESQAAALSEASDDLERALERFSELSLSDRRLIISANFPVRPADATRADLWSIINEPAFPAADLIHPLGELVKAHPDRLTNIRKYIANGAPLPACAQVECQPVACSADWMWTYHCESGSYLSAQAICVQNPKRSAASTYRAQ